MKSKIFKKCNNFFKFVGSKIFTLNYFENLARGSQCNFLKNIGAQVDPHFVVLIAPPPLVLIRH